MFFFWFILCCYFYHFLLSTSTTGTTACFCLALFKILICCFCLSYYSQIYGGFFSFFLSFFLLFCYFNTQKMNRNRNTTTVNAFYFTQDSSSYCIYFPRNKYFLLLLGLKIHFVFAGYFFVLCYTFFCLNTI